MVPPLAGSDDPLEKMSASQMRRALLDGDLKKFKTFLPESSQNQAEYIFTRVLGGTTKEEPKEEQPIGESFRASDLHGLIDEMIDEISSMAGGSIEGGALGAKGGPWHDLDTEEENEKQKQHQKLTGKSLVEEVANYLINSGTSL